MSNIKQSHNLKIRKEEYENSHLKIKPVKAFFIKLLLYFPLIIWAFITIYPFWYMIVVAGKSQAQIFSFPPPMTIDKDYINQFINNYKNLITRIPFWRNVWNTFYIASMSTLLSIFFCSLGGFGFAMYKFKGKNILFTIMLITLMIPPWIGIVPYFLMMKTFGWYNTAKAIYIPGIANAFGVFMMSQYIEASIPIDLIEAARMDGCSEFNIYWKIVFPLITPVIGSFSIITFLGTWNNFSWGLLLYSTPKKLTPFRSP